MSPAKATLKSAKTTTGKTSKGLTDEEKAAMKELIKERKAVASKEEEASARAGPLAQALVRDARGLQARQGRLLLPRRAEVQEQVRDVRLQRRGEPRRRKR